MDAARISDPDLARRLVLHEARAQHAPGRVLRDLGDGWLFHDPNDAEPFWNRLIAPCWPVEATAFDRRLDQVITMFATLGRLPHVRPLPAGSEPPDLAKRLQAAGFEAMGADRRMVLVDPAAVGATLAAIEARVAAGVGSGAVEVTRLGVPVDGTGPRRTAWGNRRRLATDAGLVLADAFSVDVVRRLAIETDVLACVSRRGCSVLLISVDGEPAAIARRATTPDGTYLSSIGTRHGFRDRGLGALATMLAVRDAIGEGSDLIHLAVDVDNESGRRLYERLGFEVIGDTAPDLLLLH